MNILFGHRGLLRAGTSTASSASATRQAYRYERGTFAITIFERISKTSALISWSDARFGQFGAQVWSASRARTAGAGALTGRIINRGDAVYTPRMTHLVPINVGAMIIASFVQEAPMAGNRSGS